MKRQLGPILVVLALLWVPAAWAQSGSTDTSQSGSTDASQNGSTDATQSGSTDGSQNGASDSSQNGSGQNSSSNPNQGGGYTRPQSIYTQNDAGLPGSANDSSQQQAPVGPQATFNHPEQLPPLSLMNEVTSNTGMQFSLSTGLSADSNASGSATTNWLSLATIYGSFGITQVRPKLVWSLTYGGGTNQTLAGSNDYNSVTQSGVANILWQFAHRWQMKVTDSYFYSNDPFQPYLTIDSPATFNNPNPTVYIPQATSQANTGTVDITYQLAPHDTIDVSGFENFMRYQGSAILSLQNSYMWAGSAFYEHVFNAKIAGGGGYEFSALDFGHGESRAGVQTFEGFINYKFTPSMSISGWIGPELTNTKDIVPLFCIPGLGCYYQVVHSSFFNVAEGASFTYSGQHSAFRVKYSHRVTNGGGLLGVVRLYMASIDYRRVLSARWSLLGEALYGNNLSLSFFGGDEYLNSLTAQVGVSRILNPSWNVNAYYAIIDQRQKNIPGYTTPQWLDNRVAISLQYNWGHSLGR
jgi:hypothetical protein